MFCKYCGEFFNELGYAVCENESYIYYTIDRFGNIIPDDDNRDEEISID